MKISSRVRSVGSYVFSDLKQKARQIESETGRPVLDLGAGNPHIPPSKNLKKRLAELVQEKENFQYPGYGAIPEFSSAVINHYRQRFGVQLHADEVLPLLGAKDGINALTLTFADPGDEILIPDPGYPAYQALAKLYGIKAVTYVGKKLNLALIKKKTTSKTKFIWVNFPSNPTGQMADKKSLSKLVEWCQKKHIWLLYDNAYSQIYFTQRKPISILEIPGAKQIALEIGSMSKSHSVAGLRIGWAVGNTEGIRALQKLKSQLDSGMSLLWQQLAANLLVADDDWQQLLIAEYKQSRLAIAKLLHSLGLNFSLPKAGLYVWVDIPHEFANSQEYANYLLEKKAILVTPGTAFGKCGVRQVRVSITQEAKLIGSYI